MFFPFFSKTKNNQAVISQSGPDGSAGNGRKKVVEIKDLRVVYNPGKINEAKALNGVSIDIYQQEYVVFFGPSGCGKSTLLNVIAGLETPSQGSVIIDGEDIAKFSAFELAKFHRNKIGMVFQSYNLIPTLNVLDNVILPQIFNRVKSPVRKKKGRELLVKFGLDKFEKRLPQELSGGQQQRVGIARSLVNDPPIIMADEAVGNLDSVSAKNVLDIIDQLNLVEKKTIVAVTHNPEHLYFADRIIYMKDGQVIRIEENKERKKPSEEAKEEKEAEQKKEPYTIHKRSRTALDLLLQSYPDMASLQLHVMLAPFKAKVLANHLISRFENDDIEQLEKIISDRLLERITDQELLQLLHAPAERGGMELTPATAAKFAQQVEEVVAKADYIKKEVSLLEKGKADPIQEIVDEIRKSLLDQVAVHLTVDQVEAINKGIEFRVLNKIGRKEFQEFLDRPYHKGGVGLNKKTAKLLAKKLEVVMLVEYGK